MHLLYNSICMKKILESKIFRIILCVIVITSMFYLPSCFNAILNYIGINNQYLCYILSLFLYVSLIVLVYLQELKSEFVTFKNNFKKCLDNGFKYWTLGLFIMIISNLIINNLIMGGNIAANEEMNRQAILENPLWYTALSIIVIAPFIEELLFRKSTDKIFEKEKYYCIFSGILFGLAHVIADLSSVLNLLYMIPYGALGYVLALMDRKTNTTFTNIMFHSLHNLMTLLLLLLIL